MSKNKTNKKIKKFFKDLREEFKSLELTKHHFYYTLLALILLILSIFLFNNYNNCQIYEVSVSSPSFSLENGLLVMSKGNNIIRLDSIKYNGDIENVTYIKSELYVLVDGEEKLLNAYTTSSESGFSLSEYTENMTFDINETKYNEDVITKKVRKKLAKNLYLRITVISVDGNEEIFKKKLTTDKLYSNSKLFY